MIDFLKNAGEIFSELVDMRRYLHRHPETGRALPETNRYIKQKLTEFGCQYDEISEGILTVVLGQGDRCVLVRADTDALPTRELSKLPFASQNGNSHSCGHDIHTASMLGAIKMLKPHERELSGRIKFLLQSDEERMLGAKAAIEAGVLENPRVEAAIGMHTAIGLKTGLFNVDAGGYLASSDAFRITVHGSAAHGSMPERGVDPIMIGAKILLEAQTITSRLINALYPVVITFGTFIAGDTFNIIPDTAAMTGTIRAFDPVARRRVKQLLASIAEGVAGTYGGKAEFEMISETPVVYNDPAMTERLLGYARELLGVDGVRRGSLMLKASDDFAYYTERVPGVMYHIGMGTEADGCRYALHNPRVVFREEAMVQAAACYAYLPMRYLEQRGKEDNT